MLDFTYMYFVFYNCFRLVVVCLHKTLVYDTNADPFTLAIDTSTPLIDTHTYNNPKGLLSICQQNSTEVYAFLGTNKGTIVIYRESFRKCVRISAHHAPLAALALSFSGEYVSTASEKGTVIRVFDAVKGIMLHEFKRGSTSVEVYTLAFSHDAQFLACTTAKETVHIFHNGTFTF